MGSVLYNVLILNPNIIEHLHIFLWNKNIWSITFFKACIKKGLLQNLSFLGINILKNFFFYFFEEILHYSKNLFPCFSKFYSCPFRSQCWDPPFDAALSRYPSTPPLTPSFLNLTEKLQYEFIQCSNIQKCHIYFNIFKKS